MNCILCGEKDETGLYIRPRSKLCVRCKTLWGEIERNLDLAKEVIERIERREAVKEITCEHRNVKIEEGYDQFMLCDLNQKECLITGHCLGIRAECFGDPCATDIYKHIRKGRR